MPAKFSNKKGTTLVVYIIGICYLKYSIALMKVYKQWSAWLLNMKCFVSSLFDKYNS